MNNNFLSHASLSLIIAMILAGCICQQSPNEEEGKNANPAVAGASISIPGKITDINGTPLYGNAKSYTFDLYYGRLSHGAKVELVSSEVAKNEFDILIVKVKVISDDDYGKSCVGKIGWVMLSDTDLGDYYDQDIKNMKGSSK